MSFLLPPADPDDPRYTKRGALHVPAGEGITKWVAGDVYTMKALAGTTDGNLGFMEATVPAGRGSSPHAHTTSAEAFFLLSGTLEFLDGTDRFTAGQGDFVYVPPGTRHQFTNRGTHTAHMLFLFTPAGPEGMFLATGDDARPGEQPPAWTPAKLAEIAPLVTTYDTILLPDPD